VLTECPVGRALRECSWVYDVIDLCASCDQVPPSEMSRWPRWFSHAHRVYRSEVARIQTSKDEERRWKSDAAYAKQVLSR